MLTNESPEQLAQTCRFLRDAIRARQSLIAFYRDVEVAFCPHVLGRRPDGPVVLAFLITAEPPLVAEPEHSPRRWRWLRVAELHGLTFAFAPWRSAPRHTRPPLAECTEVEAA